MNLKSFIKPIVPISIRSFVWQSIPKIQVVNTYLLKRSNLITNLHQINSKYSIELINNTYIEQLKKVHYTRSTESFEKIIRRLNTPEWKGLAIINKANGNIAYLAWIIDKSIPYIEEFNIKLKKNQFLLKDGYCIPKYRHQGLHTRMEQERINYSIKNGATELFIQIHDSNKKGIQSVLSNGYNLFQQNYIIRWPLFNVYREISAFFRPPFKKNIQ